MMSAVVFGLACQMPKNEYWPGMQLTRPIKYLVTISYVRKYKIAKGRKLEVYWNYANDSGTCRNVWDSVSYEGKDKEIAIAAVPTSKTNREPIYHGVISTNDMKDASTIRITHQIRGTYYWPILPKDVVEPQPLDPVEASPFLIEEELKEFKSKVFQSFLTSRNLRKLSTESTFQFARRLYDWTKKNIKYDGNEPLALSCVEVGVQKRGECLGQANFVSSVLRANGIPTKHFVGVVYQSWNGNQGTHNWCDFFDPERGWIPIDGAGGCFGEHSYIRIPFPGQDGFNQEKEVNMMLQNGNKWKINPYFGPLVLASDFEKPESEETTFKITFRK